MFLIFFAGIPKYKESFLQFLLTNDDPPIKVFLPILTMFLIVEPIPI